MPIISNVERRTTKGRIALGIIYFLLALGALTTLYPFLLMLRLATADAIDQHSLSPLPEFWWNTDVLARKYLDYQYFEKGAALAYAYGSNDWTSLSTVKDFEERFYRPLDKIPAAKIATRASDYRAFLAEADPRFLYPQFTYIPGRGYKDRWISFWLAGREGVPVNTYRYFERPRPDWRRRDWVPTYDANWVRWQEWLQWLKPEERFAFSSDYTWNRFLTLKYKGDLAALNAAHSSSHQNFVTDPTFSTEPPQPGSGMRDDWEEFVETSYPLFWQKLTPQAAEVNRAAWVDWLRDECHVRTPGDWHAFTGQTISSMDEIALSSSMPEHSTVARWWADFVAARIGWDGRILASSEGNFRSMLRRQYGTLEDLNEAWGEDFKDWQAIGLPLAETDYHTIHTHGWRIKSYLTFKNFRQVLDSLLFEGRAFWNTAVIIVLSVVTSLTVNPVAAYALSRFKLRNTNKILIFLLATMALPSEVALVPSFLLVRDLGLTDSYLALVLPGAANAFSIFLLKGFFDSLPPELYEAALLDGAGEATIFFRITIPLSMPIIAVTLLGTIVGAYNLFMPAVMYIGDTSMWPIAAKIYEINQTSGVGVGMAALVIASIFPLVVFTFCQRIIMRGIILPTMK